MQQPRRCPRGSCGGTLFPEYNDNKAPLLCTMCGRRFNLGLQPMAANDVALVGDDEWVLHESVDSVKSASSMLLNGAVKNSVYTERARVWQEREAAKELERKVMVARHRDGYKSPYYNRKK